MKKIGVIGGGIIGLATALKIQNKFPHSKVFVFDKESKLGELLDPIADKIIVATALILLVIILKLSTSINCLEIIKQKVSS